MTEVINKVIDSDNLFLNKNFTSESTKYKTINITSVGKYPTIPFFHSLEGQQESNIVGAFGMNSKHMKLLLSSNTTDQTSTLEDLGTCFIVIQKKTSSTYYNLNVGQCLITDNDNNQEQQYSGQLINVNTTSSYLNQDNGDDKLLVKELENKNIIINKQTDNTINIDHDGFLMLNSVNASNYDILVSKINFPRLNSNITTLHILCPDNKSDLEVVRNLDGYLKSNQNLFYLCSILTAYINSRNHLEYIDNEPANYTNSIYKLRTRTYYYLSYSEFTTNEQSKQQSELTLLGDDGENSNAIYLLVTNIQDTLRVVGLTRNTNIGFDNNLYNSMEHKSMVMELWEEQTKFFVKPVLADSANLQRFNIEYTHYPGIVYLKYGDNKYVRPKFNSLNISSTGSKQELDLSDEEYDWVLEPAVFNYESEILYGGNKQNTQQTNNKINTLQSSTLQSPTLQLTWNKTNYI